jgi:tetratricopeptide (TPR) repeat protein
MEGLTTEMVTTERYLRLTQLAQRAYGKGRLERALRIFLAAEQEARRTGDQELTDRAFCNRCVVLLELERLEGAVGELKSVLMRSRDPFTAWMAAYYSAQVYEFEGNIGRALAYARRASESATTCGDRRAEYHSSNQHGVLALRDSRFAEAAERFQKALQIGAEIAIDTLSAAITRDNLGYCLMCTGQAADGLELCRDAAATLETLGARQFLADVYQDLCFGALQMDDFVGAQRLGEKALEMARLFQHDTVERNTLMLLADAALDSGDEDAADELLNRLATHYPDFRGMKAFMRAFNVREVINLKA